MPRQLVIKKLELPKQGRLDEDINWVCESLGLVSGRDTERTCERIVNLLLRTAGTEDLTVERIAKELGIAQQRVNYHLRSLIESGLFYREKKKIKLREGSLKAALEELRKDLDRILEEIISIAEEIDKSLGLQNR